jgi:hypothetical protein
MNSLADFVGLIVAPEEILQLQVYIDGFRY